MKIVSVDVLQCEGGWRTQNFVKIQTDEGITGYAECNCQRTDRMVKAAIDGQGPFSDGSAIRDLWRASMKSRIALLLRASVAPVLFSRLLAKAAD